MGLLQVLNVTVHVKPLAPPQAQLELSSAWLGPLLLGNALKTVLCEISQDLTL